MITERYLFQIEEMLAITQERKPCAVVFAEFPVSHAGVISMFERDSYTIYFNMDLIDAIDENELVGLLIHEGRHAYQWYQVTNPDKRKESLELIDSWKKDFDSYLQPTEGVSPNEYAGQSLEIDAVAYSSIIIAKLDMGNLVIPENIKPRVDLRIKEINATLKK